MNKLINPFFRINSGMYKIINKESELVSFHMNPSQEIYWYYEDNYRLIKCLKGRQIGITTLKCIMGLDRALWLPNQTVVITAHTIKKQQDIFKKCKIAYDNLPEQVVCDGMRLLKPKANIDNKNELSFEGNNSTIKVALDSRSGTVSSLHVTELAFIRDAEDMMTGTLPSVPKNAPITVETTANGQSGVGKYFYDFWRADNGFYPLFISWFHQKEYESNCPNNFKFPSDIEVYRRFLGEFSKEDQDNKLYWYYEQSLVQGKKMKQEYPTYPEEAFLTTGDPVIDPYLIKKLEEIELYSEPDKTYGHLHIYRPPEDCVIGIDTAGGGRKGDYTCFVGRNHNYDLLFHFYSRLAPYEAIEVLEHITELGYTGLIVPEVNATSGGQIIELLQNSDTIMSGQDIYRRTNSTEDVTDKRVGKYGFLTTSKTRNELLDHYEQVINTGTVDEFDPRELHELKYFIHSDKGKREASTGENDDAIMADGICCYVIENEDIANRGNAIKMISDFYNN